MHPSLWISLAASLATMAGCTAKNDKLGTTHPSEPDASDVTLVEAGDDGDAASPPDFDAADGDAAIKDAGIDADAGPTEPLPPNCIQDWPESPNAQPVPSIPDVTPAVLWTKPVPQTPFPAIEFKPQLVWTGTHLAFSGANRLWILDADGEVSAIVNLGEVQFVSEPVADEEGTFYFGSVELYAVRPDGSFKWKKQLGPNVSPSVEMTRTSAIALSPDGILYFAATDGYIYAVRSEDGSTVWKHPLVVGEFLQNGSLPRIATGIGDTIIIGGIPHLRATGEPAGGPLVHKGIKLDAKAGLYSRQHLATQFFFNPSTRGETYMFDACGKLLWELSGSSSWSAHLVTFEELLLVQEGRAGASHYDYAHIYSHAGEHLLGPAPMPGTARLIGADGTIYATQCSEGERSTMTLATYAPTLDHLWSLELGTPCTTWNMPTLAADGKLYVLSIPPEGDAAVTITAIQTASPGLANTSAPNEFHNNRRTRWLGL